MKSIIQFLILFALLSENIACAETLKPFGMASRASIEQAHKGQAIILSFWSIDCAYCLDELSDLAKVVAKHPKIQWVLVNVDGLNSSQEIIKVLKKILTENAELWQFAEPDEERLRFNVNKSWYGELPRTYFYDTQHQVKVFSGSPDAAWLKAWAAKY